jgi:hypothetical protein
MCHGKMRRYEERRQEERPERLWDLFHRETRESPPPTPVVERESPDPDREEVLTGGRRPNE